MLRSGAASLLIGLGALLVLVVSLLVWVDRTVFNEENFVAVGTDALDEPDVREAIAIRVTNTIFPPGSLETRLSDTLSEASSRDREGGPVIPVVSAVLAEQTREVTINLVERLLAGERFQAVVEAALERSHRTFIAFIEDGERGSLAVTDGKLVLNLDGVAASVAENLSERGLIGGDDAEADEESGEAASGATIVLLDTSGLSLVWDILDARVAIIIACAIVALGFVVAGIFLSRNRRRAIIWAAVAVGAVTLLGSILASGPIRSLIVELAATTEGTAAAKQIYDSLTDGFLIQQLFIVLIAALIAVTAWATAPERGEGIKGRATGLRLAGFAIAAATLLALPGQQGLVLTLVLLAVYLAVLELLVSEQAWAVNTREKFASSVDDVRTRGAGEGLGVWANANIWELRVVGLLLVLPLSLLLAWVDFWGLTAAIAMALVYFGGLELLASSGRSEPEDAG
ncbi:MAG TPA: hypothetical protein VFZ12_07630 [Dehalococcoidia bacterium]|nr:hypothetical protein [Dehalococcoidia bacterium]